MDAQILNVKQLKMTLVAKSVSLSVSCGVCVVYTTSYYHYYYYVII